MRQDEPHRLSARFVEKECWRQLFATHFTLKKMCMSLLREDRENRPSGFLNCPLLPQPMQIFFQPRLLWLRLLMSPPSFSNFHLDPLGEDRGDLFLFSKERGAAMVHHILVSQNQDFCYFSRLLCISLINIKFLIFLEQRV